MGPVARSLTLRIPTPLNPLGPDFAGSADGVVEPGYVNWPRTSFQDMNTGNGWYPSMFGAPNLWAVDSSGKFSHMWETEAYRQALGFDVDLYKPGVFHSDSVSLNVITAALAFEGRQGATVVTGLRPDFWDIRGTPAEGFSRRATSTC